VLFEAGGPLCRDLCACLLDVPGVRRPRPVPERVRDVEVRQREAVVVRDVDISLATRPAWLLLTSGSAASSERTAASMPDSTFR
jgi:hypothetical protein